MLDFAEIEKLITTVSVTNTPKYREEIARAFIAKSVYNATNSTKIELREKPLKNKKSIKKRENFNHQTIKHGVKMANL